MFFILKCEEAVIKINFKKNNFKIAIQIQLIVINKIKFMIKQFIFEIEKATIN